jgi:signal transduction histidine kinase
MAMTSKKKQSTQRRANAAKKAPEGAEQVIELLHRLDTMRDQERKHLSRELHDSLVSTLSAAKLECDWLLRAQSTNEAENRRRLSRISQSLAEAIQLTRGVIDQLWPAAMQHLGLVGAIQGQLSDLRTRLRVEVQLDVQEDMDTLPEAHALTLYRAIQEALRFAVEKQPPARLELALRRSGKGVELRLDLDGGARPRTNAASHSHLEGDLMRERVMRLGGEYLLADDGQGAMHLRVFLPLPSHKPRPARLAARHPDG